MTLVPSKRRDFFAVVLLLAVVSLLLAYSIEVRREHRQLAPPNSAYTLLAFSHQMKPPFALEHIDKNGRVYFIWHGELAGPISVPSGRSCYIFDDLGHLVHWQAETGVGGFADSFGSNPAKVRKISLESALEIVHNSSENLLAGTGLILETGKDSE